MSNNSNYGEHIKKYMSLISTNEFDPLSFSDEHDMLMDTSLTQEQKNEYLVKHNIRLATKIAKKYTNIAEYDDMMQEGIIGLYNATKSFDPTRGIKFCTYAYFYVFKAIQEFLKRENRSFSTIRNHSGYSLDMCPDSSSEDTDMSANSKLEQLIQESTYTTQSSGCDTVMCQETYNLLSDINSMTTSHNTLTDREKFIIRHRFLTNRKTTLKNLGSMLNISHSMVKLIETRALYKMKIILKKSGVSMDDFLLRV